MKHFPLATLLAAVGVLSAGAAQAQSAGSILLRGGVTRIGPEVQSGDLTPAPLPGLKVDISPATNLSGGVSYMVTDHIAVDVPIAPPFQHDILGAGTIDFVGKVGSFKSLPITVMGQYRFLEPSAAFRPYLGAGATYARFFGAQASTLLSVASGGTLSHPTSMHIASKLAPTLQVGATYALNPHWFIDASVMHTFLSTRTTLSSGQTLDTKVDPTTLSMSVGYAF
jgi:outer membrane protein